MLGIIDYGLSNINSIANAIDKLNYKFEIINKAKNLDKYEKIILPGVGSFPHAMKNLKKKKLIEPLVNFIHNDKKPFLGICLGMQLLYESSSEGTQSKGLGILNGSVKRLVPTSNFRSPNMGWREIKIKKKSILLNNIIDKPIFYFVHKFACYSDDKECVIAELNYIKTFDCVIEKNNIFATQFHPEKSEKIGFQVLNNFLKI